MKPMRMVQFAGGIALAAAGLWFFFRKVDLHKLVSELLACNPWTIFLCAALAVASLFFRTLRWNIMLPGNPAWSKKGLFSIIAVSFMINNILPARMGEVARAVLLWKKNGFSPAVSIGSLILERAIDLLGFMACFFVPVFVLDSMQTTTVGPATSAGLKNLTLFTFALALCGIFCGVLASFFLYGRFPRHVRGIGKKLAALLPASIQKKVNKMAGEVLLNLHWTTSARKSALVCSYTALIMLCYAGMILALINDFRFTILHGLFANAFAALGAAIPLAPGFVGTLHAVLLQGLLFCGLSREKASAVTILYHAIGYCTVTVIGLYFYFKMQIKVKEISEAEKAINV
jgi:glycosyltransferase 2 family protein